MPVSQLLLEPTDQAEPDAQLRQYSVKQVAVFCGVSEKTVQRWIEDEKVEAKRFGKSLRVSRPEMLRLAREGVAL